MVFKKLLGAFGVGGPSVDTVLSNPATRPGLTLTGQVNLTGGDHDVEIEHITLSLVTKVEVEGGEHEFSAPVEFHRQQVAGATRLPAGGHHAFPFELPVPWETPITDVYGQHLHGMTMGVRTEVAIARAIDKGDLDPIQVHPLPAHEAILEAMARLGFRFRSADLEGGHIRGSQQTLPFFQEIEFFAAPQYAHACSQVEVTFITNPGGVEVIFEVDKRGGLFSGGHDVYHRLHVPHADPGQTDWAAAIDGWFQQAVLAHAATYGGHHGGKHGHGHGGAGSMAAAGAAGALGGFLIADAVDDAFEGGFEGGFEDFGGGEE